MDNKLCTVHNEPALFCEKDANQQQVFLCRFCVEQKFKIQNIDDAVNEEKQALQQLEIQFDQSIKLLKDFAEVLEQFTSQINQKLIKFKHQVQQSILIIIEKKDQVKNISRNFTNLQLNEIVDQKNIINNQLTQIILQLNNRIKELEISSKLNELYQSIEDRCRLQQQADIKKIPKIDQKFYYQLMQQSSYKQNEKCTAIAFNQDSSIMIANCDKLIKVFEFKDDKLREFQQLKLNDDSYDVSVLHFMKKTNQFISASYDLNIWEQNKNNQWQNNQVLKGYSHVKCIAINYNENLLISGSADFKIKFWNKQNNTWKCNQSIDCESYVYSISLSNYENKLIASVFDKQILVIKLQEEEWIIKQKISVEQYGYRLCYINSDQFVFQPRDGQHLFIFDYDPKDKNFKKGQKLQYLNKASDGSSLFPIRYIQKIGLIIVKNDHQIHLINKSVNDQFTVEQSIDFDTDYFFGSVTDDGRYIATWDVISKEIQIRKFQY